MIPDWRRAEAELDAGRPLGAAGAALPERRRWILEAMSALHDGRPAVVAATAEAAGQAGHADLRALLLGLLDPETNPPAWPARGPLAEVPDLVRRWAAGGKPRGSKALRAQMGRRPALNALIGLTGRTAGELYRNRALARLSPRAEAVFLAARGHILGFVHLRLTLEQLGRLGLDWSEARYPDLDHFAANGDPIARWCAGAEVDKEDLEDAAKALRRKPDADRRAALGRLLDALPRRLHARGAYGTYDGMRVAADLLGSLSDLKVLRRQLDVACSRVHRLAHPNCLEVDPLVGVLRLPLSAQERAIVAVELLDAERAPPSVGREAALAVLAGGTDAQRAEALEEAGALLTRPEVEAALRDTPAAEREYLLANHALACLQPAAALRSAEVLLRLPGGADRGAQILSSAWSTLPDRPGGLLRDRLAAAAEAMVAAEVPLARLAALSYPRRQADPALDGVARALQRATEAALARPVPPDQVGYALGLELSLGLEARATERVRGLAGTFRALSADAADDRALELLAQVATALAPQPTAEQQRVVQPLWARLTRDQGRHLPDALGRCAQAPSESWLGLLVWFAAVYGVVGAPPKIAAALAPIVQQLGAALGSDLGDAFDDDPIPW